MKTWDITRTLYKVGDFVSWQRHGSLQLSPSFQRRPVWSRPAKSFLIDTIVRGLPIPIIFIRELIDLGSLKPKRQIVDGQQRIRTVLSYVDPDSLDDYKESRDYFEVKRIHNSELGGKSFDQLGPDLQRRILNYPFSVHVLSSDVDDKQVLQIFGRMNATGVKLNAQELRNATYFGHFKETMYNLAYEQLARWREWGIFTENNLSRMEEVEMTSDFILLMHKGISKKTKSSLDKLYKDLDESFPAKPVIETRFRSVMDSLDDALGEELRYLQFKKKTLFYALFTLVYDCHYSVGSVLVKRSKRPLPSGFAKNIRALSESIAAKAIPEDVAISITRRTTDPSSRRAVFEYLKRRCMRG